CNAQAGYRYCGRLSRKAHGEGGFSLCRRVDEVDLSAMRLSDFSHDEQSEPEPFPVFATAGPDKTAPKRREELADISRVERRAFVGHLEPNRSVLGDERHPNGRAGAAVIDRITDKVAEQLLQTPRIPLPTAV